MESNVILFTNLGQEEKNARTSNPHQSEGNLTENNFFFGKHFYTKVIEKMYKNYGAQIFSTFLFVEIRTRKKVNYRSS